MELTPKETTFLTCLNNYDVEYLIVGGMAVEFYAPSRKRNDIDIWLNPIENNVSKFISAIYSLIGNIPKLTVNKLAKPGIHFPLSNLGYKVDVLTSLKDISFSFEKAYNKRAIEITSSVSLSFIEKGMLIESKQSANEQKDLNDINLLNNV